MDNIGALIKKFGEVSVEKLKKICPKCGKEIEFLREVLPIRVKVWILPVVTIKFTIEETYHPDCGFAKFEIVELADLQRKVKNCDTVKDFLEYTVQKWLDILVQEESKNKRMMTELKKAAGKE